MRTHTERVCRNAQKSLAYCSMSPTKRVGTSADVWRLASCKRRSGELNHHSETQAASVASVSPASGGFEDFSVGGVAADAKWSKLTTGVSTPRAKI
jgi:hypothetical protein